MNNWQKRSRPERLEKRFEFNSYEITRDFLDHLGDYSESINRFADISFGKTYVNLTIRPEDENEELSNKDYQFAQEIDSLINHLCD